MRRFRVIRVVLVPALVGCAALAFLFRDLASELFTGLLSAPRFAAHVVADGETIDSIASASGTDAESIARYNRLEGLPRVGRVLIVPLGEGSDRELFDNPPILVRRGATDRPRIALALDAGGGAGDVATILAVLHERHLTITFFLTGRWIQKNPDTTRKIVAEGHEIGNHTLNHLDLTTVYDWTIRRELSETERILRETAGADVSIRPFFRPPFGARNDHVLQVVQSEGYLPIYWTLDSLDGFGEPKTADYLFERLTTQLPPEDMPGAILLAHCGSPTMAEALPRVLDRYAEMNLEVTTVSRVLP